MILFAHETTKAGTFLIDCFSLIIKSKIERNIGSLVYARKFYIRRNNNKADSIETGRIVITHLLP